MMKKALWKYRKKTIYLSITNNKILNRIKKSGFRPIKIHRLPTTILLEIFKETFKLKTLFGNLKIVINHKIHNLVRFPKK